MSNNPNNEIKNLKTKIYNEFLKLKDSKDSKDQIITTKECNTLVNKIKTKYIPKLSKEAILLLPKNFLNEIIVLQARIDQIDLNKQKK